MLAKLSPRRTVRRAARRHTVAGAIGLAMLGAGLPTTSADDPQPDLTRFYRQKVAWKTCEGADPHDGPQCGKVTVPLDYARPGAGTLDLALARYRASGEKRGSLLLNFGGPGGSGVTELTYGGDDFMGLTDAYDVVSFDPRGVGRSSPVSCGNNPYGGAPVIAGTDETLRDPNAVLRQLRTAAEQCAKHSGPVLPHIGTVNVSRDMDVIRQALGDDKLNYLGFSYGSRLGAVYAAQFPDKVGRVALDGVDTLTESLAEQGVAGAAGQQVALDDFLDWCVKDVSCPFGQDARTAREEVARLVRSMDEDPVPTAFSGEFTGQDLVGALSQALYSKDMWPSLERALASLVEDGDTRGVEAFATGGIALPGLRQGTQKPSPSADGGLVDQEDVPLDNLPAALMAINCADDPDRPTARQITRNLGRLRALYEEASPVFGRFRLTQVLLCYGRPKGTDFIREKVKDVDTPKMLLVGTRGDPATPYRWTVQTAKRLGPSAVVLDNKGEGHTAYPSSKCVHSKIDAFLLYGTLPASGSSCGPENGEGAAP
ncbi:alpha/beta fold hydrolase [Streptomyces spinoverrucosus]|uniref:alpha/beta hydrolase n=1 Tax=Streptomyces spinoverrucosus TaxID=284043 RepID=UPI0018C37817|nr:alpha/beta hydrolase [Streptomyces spinoverrucosus]MBG0857482.1 alpha/beta fold hydrolase [Streptomyces spinoverrucosus]